MSKVREFKSVQMLRDAYTSDPQNFTEYTFNPRLHLIEKTAADQLAEALERITNYPKYYASSLSNGFLDSSKTMEGQFEIVKNIAKQALKNYQEGE